MKYTERFIIYNKKIDYLVFDFDKEYQLLTTFLSSDVTPFEDWIKDAFDKVILGQSEYEEVNGNVCHVEISAPMTKVYDNLTEDDEEYYNTCCEVDTKELRNLIEEWCDKIREFKKMHHN